MVNNKYACNNNFNMLVTIINNQIILYNIRNLVFHSIPTLKFKEVLRIFLAQNYHPPSLFHWSLLLFKFFNLKNKTTCSTIHCPPSSPLFYSQTSPKKSMVYTPSPSAHFRSFISSLCWFCQTHATKLICSALEWRSFCSLPWTPRSLSTNHREPMKPIWNCFYLPALAPLV